jgi:Protein of unknown function (DUF3179)
MNRITILGRFHSLCWTCLCCLGAVLLAGCGGSNGPPEGAAKLPSLPGGLSTPFIVPGIRQPAMISVAEAQLPDETRVVGIVHGTEARAYTVNSLSRMMTHVVNDLIQDVPVSITYCDLSDCARVLTTGTRGTPIDLWTGGFTNGQLQLRFEERQYTHMSEELPLEDYPFTVTTLKEWRESHPDTLVYVGGGEPAFPDLPEVPLPAVRWPNTDHAGGETSDPPVSDSEN